MKAGDRVRLSALGVISFVENKGKSSKMHANIEGTVIRVDRAGMLVVHRDGFKTVGSSWHPDFWEPVEVKTLPHIPTLDDFDYIDGRLSRVAGEKR